MIRVDRHLQRATPATVVSGTVPLADAPVVVTMGNDELAVAVFDFTSAIEQLRAIDQAICARATERGAR